MKHVQTTCAAAPTRRRVPTRSGLALGTALLALVATGCAAEASSSLSVETIGQSPYGLVSAERPEGSAEEVSGTLIVGPGEHLALTQDDQPQLLAFQDGADFTLREDRPSVTTADQETLEVGEEVELPVIEVDRDSLTDIPQERVSGASDTALVATSD